MKIDPCEMKYRQNENFGPMLDYNYCQKDTLLEILIPLKEFKFDFFIYRTIYDDGKLVFLCTDQEWLQKRFSPLCTQTVLRKQIRDLPEGQFKAFSWSEGDKKDPVYNLLKEKKISNGISLYRRKSSFLESFHFATKSEDVNLPLILVNERLTIEKFLRTFIQTAEDIITPKRSLITLNEVHYSYKPDLLEQIKGFPSKFYLNTDQGRALLSKRECEILLLLTRLMSSKEIGRYLNISNRTVEGTLENIKNKTGISSRSKLFQCMEENDMLRCFNLYFPTQHTQEAST